MSRDKQLRRVELEDVLQKRQLDQALNAKEFAVLTGISYTAARQWFRQPGFPVIRGVVFWDDFVQWRRTQTGLAERKGNTAQQYNRESASPALKASMPFSPRASRILAEAG